MATKAILKGIMKEVGFEVFEAGHGREALECLKTIGKRLSVVRGKYRNDIKGVHDDYSWYELRNTGGKG